MPRNAPKTLPRFKSDESRGRYLAAYNAALAEWPVPYEELELPTSFGSTHVIAGGADSAPGLVLLPSFAASATVWRLNVAELSRHFRVFAIDVVGQPGKSVMTQRIGNRRQYARWLIEVLDALRLEVTSLVGCSFGGFLAMNQALETPERIRRVVLISPVGTFSSQYWKLVFAMRIRAPLRKLGRRLTRSVLQPSLNDLRAKNAVASPRDAKWAVQIGVTMSEKPEVNVINPTVFTNAQLRSISAPTLLLIGQNETLYEPHEALRLAQNRMPHLKGAIISGADHIAAMAQPERVNERILEFLGQASPRQTT
jgi:pimeloyl-ACP methyl ester carboxylesterase